MPPRTRNAELEPEHLRFRSLPCMALIDRLPPPPPSGAPKRARRSTSLDVDSIARPTGLNMPENISTLSVEVAHDGVIESGPLSVTSLTNAPLSAILGAFGFGSGGPGGVLPFSPTMQTGRAFSPAPPPLSSITGHAQAPLFGLAPMSIREFVGPESAQLLEAALEAPLSTRPLSHSRKSPRLSDWGSGSEAM
jgi:hypothetical protein